MKIGSWYKIFSAQKSGLDYEMHGRDIFHEVRKQKNWRNFFWNPWYDFCNEKNDIK